MTVAEWGKSLIVAGILIVITAAALYPFWPDTAVGGSLGASLIMGGGGLFTSIIGACMRAK